MDVVMGPGESTGGRPGSWLPGGPGLLKRPALSQLVVSAAGVSSWEMLHIGVPLALVAATENQTGNYRWMSAMGAVWPLGSYAEGGFSQGLESGIRQVPTDLLAGAPPARPVVDGLGALRVTDALLRTLS